MNKPKIWLSTILTLCVGLAIYFSAVLQSPILSFTSGIKLFYHETIENIQNTFHYHFNQKSTIIALEEKNKRYEKEILQLHQVAYEYKKVLEAQKSVTEVAPKVSLVRSLSYASFGNSNRVWIDMHPFDPKKVYGLLYRGYVAGVVVADHGKPLALLNGDPKSSYAVSVGASMASGIARGDNSKYLLVEFIPTWIPISVGDEVVTSGLDQIFLAGLKVGKVISISKVSGYQRAVIEPYFYNRNPAYFHVIQKNY